MNDYIARFNEARSWTDFRFAGMSNYPLRIDQGFQIDAPALVAAIAKDLHQFIDTTADLPGRSFIVARELSYIIGAMNIRHTVTVGDIRLNDGLHAKVSRERLATDLEAGYQLEGQGGTSAAGLSDAHCWITLENGQVIDATILATLHQKSSAAACPLSFMDAIYYSGKPGVPDLEFIPMVTGFVYLQRVLASPQDGHYPLYLTWYRDFNQMMCNIDLERLAPVLQEA